MTSDSHSTRAIADLPRSIALFLLRAYKWGISPLFMPSCRYVPTCSEYAAEAIERYGVMRGSCMSLRRVLRCHPLVKGGLDPVVKPHCWFLIRPL